MIRQISILLVIFSLSNDKSIIDGEKSARNSCISSLNATSIHGANSFQQEMIHKFKSTLNTVENMIGGPVQTNHEISYHTFDYKNKVVKMRSYSETKGRWLEFSYKMKSFYKENQWDYVIICEDRVIKEIWFSPAANHVGYDLHEGTRLTFLNLKRIK